MKGVYMSDDYGVNWNLSLDMADTSLGEATNTNNRPAQIAMSSNGKKYILQLLKDICMKVTIMVKIGMLILMVM